MFSSTIAWLQFTSKSDNSNMFILHTNRGIILILLYVDDMFIQKIEA